MGLARFTSRSNQAKHSEVEDWRGPSPGIGQNLSQDLAEVTKKGAAMNSICSSCKTYPRLAQLPTTVGTILVAVQTNTWLCVRSSMFSCRRFLRVPECQKPLKAVFFGCRKAWRAREMKECPSTKQCKYDFERSWFFNKSSKPKSFAALVLFLHQNNHLVRSCPEFLTPDHVCFKLRYLRVELHVFAELFHDISDRLIHPEHSAVVIWWCCRDVSKRAN